MTQRITTISLPTFTKQLIGLDNLVGAFTSEPSKYPLVNLYRQGPNYQIDMALAGFDKDHIEVAVEQNTLTVQTSDAYYTSYKESVDEVFDYVTTECSNDQKVCLHKDISYRPFVKTFRLIEHLNVKTVEMKNGILSIFLELELPERLKPKTFKIK